MKIYVSKKYNPYFTLSMEEILVKNLQKNENIVYLYQHNNAVIIGKNQNTNEEINLDIINKEKIQIARRISGGGAVYHDLGNINFSFITEKESGKTYEDFLKPIKDFLISLGLNAKFKGRNDLVIDDAKISGNAQFIYEDKICHHGTLLFDVNLKKLTQVLMPNKLKIQSKGIKSIRQRVTNIKEELLKINKNMDEKTFLKKLIDFFIKKGFDMNELPEEKYQKELNELMIIKKSKNWIFGKNPLFSVTEEAKFDGGILKVKYNIEKNKFKNIKFEGDFLSTKNIEELYKKIIDMDYDKNIFAKFLDNIDLKNYFGKIQKIEILQLIFK